MNRLEQLTRLKQTTEWDVIVIGGGLADLEHVAVVNKILKQLDF
jgi:coenzyme F420-reducing hydrogenase gamma subunit